ncbi:hypothetical protein BGW37DRAFT_424291 [Umbelopsis sp. PMI_123]|nr:hypothetical protein BGW37DRAFT_424291 [Umbelopsis sp. PMI_123]
MEDGKVVKESRNPSTTAAKKGKEKILSKKDQKQELDLQQKKESAEHSQEDETSSEPENDEHAIDSKIDYESANEDQERQAELQKQEDANENDVDEKEQEQEGPEIDGQDSVSELSESEDEEQQLLEKLVGCKVNKEGNVVDKDHNVIGKVVTGNRKKAIGRRVKENGAIIDSKGNFIAGVAPIGPQEVEDEQADTKLEEKGEDQAEENAPTEEETTKAPIPEDAPTVDESGNIVTESGEVVGKLKKGNRHKLAGMPVDEEGNVVDEEGNILGLAELNPPEKTEEEKKAEAEAAEAEAQEQEQRKIAGQMCENIENCLQSIKPIIKMIKEHIEAEERKPENERDEEGLVSAVRPLIEEGSNILGEANGAIRGLDPTGKIAKTAQAKSAEGKASPEEYHLAELLANLTGEVTQTIENAKKKIAGMPHAEEQLSPLWTLLQNPLLQILAAVGLLLSGVLGLLGNILNGLGLGGLVNNLLGGLGIDKILENLGVGSLFGKKKKKSK